MRALIHIYTGDGKGKTSCGIGMALRFAGYGNKVVIVQFCKGSETGELRSLEQIPEITVLRNSRDYGFWASCSEAEKQAQRSENAENLNTALELLKNEETALLVLDELMFSYSVGAIDRATVETLIENKPQALELVLTGRDAPEFFLSRADYISEINCLRHPFDKGTDARVGIEY